MIKIEVNNGIAEITAEGAEFTLVSEFIIMLEAIKNEDTLSTLFNTALTLHEEKQK